MGPVNKLVMHNILQFMRWEEPGLACMPYYGSIQAICKAAPFVGEGLLDAHACVSVQAEGWDHTNRSVSFTR